MTQGITSKKSITRSRKPCNTCATCNTSITFMKGQSLFELLLAIGVSAIMITVLVSLVNKAVQNADFSRNQTLATRYAEAATEWLRTQRDANVTTFLANATTAPMIRCLSDASLTDTSWNNNGACTSGEVVSGTPFTRQVNFTSLPLAKTVIRASITVSWTDAKGTHVVSSATDFSDWRQR